jgi:uncharacterized RDD family membrane protein YckC
VSPGSYLEPATYAGFARRSAAALFDFILFNIVANLIVDTLLSGRGTADVPLSETAVTLVFMVIILCAWIYHVVCWHWFLGTPGKLLLNCQVVDAQTGHRLTLAKASLRFASYAVSLLTLSVGFLWIIWDKRKQGLHDKIAGSAVVYNAHLEPRDLSQKSMRELLDEIR